MKIGDRVYHVVRKTTGTILAIGNFAVRVKVDESCNTTYLIGGYDPALLELIEEKHVCNGVVCKCKPREAISF